MSENAPVTEQQKELAALAMQEFERKQFTSCCNVMNKLMAHRGNDSRVVHNKAVADFCLSGSQSTDEFRQSLANVCQMVSCFLNKPKFKYSHICVTRSPKLNSHMLINVIVILYQMFILKVSWLVLSSHLPFTVSNLWAEILIWTVKWPDLSSHKPSKVIYSVSWLAA